MCSMWIINMVSRYKGVIKCHRSIEHDKTIVRKTGKQNSTTRKLTTTLGIVYRGYHPQAFYSFWNSNIPIVALTDVKFKICPIIFQPYITEIQFVIFYLELIINLTNWKYKKIRVCGKNVIYCNITICRIRYL